MNLIQKASNSVVSYFRGHYCLPIKKINLLFTHCNLKCPMCIMNANSSSTHQVLRDYPFASKGPQLDLKQYKKFFDRLQKYKPFVSISGGEPFTYVDLIPLLNYLTKERRLDVNVTTNGTLFDENKIRSFAATQAQITMSIDGLRNTHDMIRGKGNFDKTMEFIKRLVSLKRDGQYKRPISCLLTLHSANFSEIADVADYLLDDIGIDHLTYSSLIFISNDILKAHEQWVHNRNLSEKFMINIPKGGIDSVADFEGIDFRQLWQCIESIRNKHKKVRFEPDFSTQGDMELYFLTNNIMKDYFATTCNPSLASFTLLSNGDVLFYPGCFEIKCGNILEEDPLAIWTSRTCNEIRKVLSSGLSPVCSHCCSNRIGKKI